ncbi:MAG: hypothetical protein FWG68_02790 [Defluviitaleaceae bacterium]|nr:hypothetical protein [Defluviitaleaceae bacterium]
MKFRTEVETSLENAKDCLFRATSAAHLRDEISRAYYACFHSMITAIWLKQRYIKAFGTAHESILDQYIKLYNNTKGTSIVKSGDMKKKIRNWRKLRNAADYYLDDDFAVENINKTKKELAYMLDFANAHIRFAESTLAQQA